ncbi:MAG: SusD/RagB family nutrient-binding outer membrane lipoprotein [Flavobacteriaceae bacterium]|nr:SusD/RagB family nutrient-binding outer membrane lipoprotein [Flavobacteriaceae bacterium]
MKKKINKWNWGVLALSIMLFISCESVELDQTENPAAATPDQSEVELFLNTIQIDFGRNMGRFNRIGAQLTRIEYMFGRDYLNNYPPSTMNTIWTEAYQGMFEDITTMKPNALNAELYDHIGIAETLQAYMLINLVDFIGDVPFTQANDSDSFPLPQVDQGSSVYQAALDLLNSAENNFNQTSLGTVGNDFYYGGDISKWQKLINTLRMKIYLQTRLVDSMAMTNFNIIAGDPGAYISSNEDDFQFSWGDNVQNPDTRHPDYVNNYTVSGANGYISNWLMYKMLGDQANGTLSTLPIDPRIQYYFVRQKANVPGVDGTPPDGNLLGCSQQSPPSHYSSDNPIYASEWMNQFCGLSNGYWGRAHGNDEGGPGDGFHKTTYGVYPAGGLFDDNDFEEVAVGSGGGGAGISPIMLASYVDFMLAEAAMDPQGSGLAAAKMHMLDGLNKSITKVQSFATLDISADPITFATPTQNSNFVNAVEMAWDNGGTIDKWNLLAEQYFITQFGAGMDAYNFYRRNGFPHSLTPNLEANDGNFIRSFFYPDTETGANPNISQKPNHDVQVFWDMNPSSPGFPQAN